MKRWPVGGSSSTQSFITTDILLALNDLATLPATLPATLQTLGLELPSPAFLLGAVVFGLIGMVAFASGRNTGRPQRKWLGVALMAYPYVITQTGWMLAAGAALCAALYFERD